MILFVDGRPVGSVVADAEGNWRLTLNADLPDGEHEISAIADPAGNESGVNAITLTIDTADDGSVRAPDRSWQQPAVPRSRSRSWRPCC